MPLLNNLDSFRKTAIKTAYETYYGRPFKRPHGKVGFQHREPHGMLHALGCMDLIRPIDTLYQKHVPDYNVAMQAIADEFSLTRDVLLVLVEIAALFHDSARRGEKDDHRDKSGDNLEVFLRTLKLTNPQQVPVLATLLANTIRFKDNKVGFESAHSPMTTVTSQQKEYLRHLVNTADTLEMIRVQNCFKFQTLPIFSLGASQIIDVQRRAIADDVEILLKQATRRIAQEGRLRHSNPTFDCPVRNKKERILQQPAAALNQETQLKAWNQYCETESYIAWKQDSLNPGSRYAAAVSVDASARPQSRPVSDKSQSNSSFSLSYCIALPMTALGALTLIVGFALGVSIAVNIGLSLVISGAVLCAIGFFSDRAKAHEALEITQKKGCALH
jgi:hypothetical protein